MVSMKANIETTNSHSSINCLSSTPSSPWHFIISIMNEIAVYSAALEINDWNAELNIKISLINLCPHLDIFDKPSGNLCWQASVSHKNSKISRIYENTKYEPKV